MFEAQATEFPFVEALPKREKGKFAKMWDEFNAIRKAMAANPEMGMLVPQHLAAELLGVSKQRIWFLANEGRFECVELGGQRLLSERSIIDYAKAERKSGRPCKVPETDRDMWDASMRAAKAMFKK